MGALRDQATRLCVATFAEGPRKERPNHDLEHPRDQSDGLGLRLSTVAIPDAMKPAVRLGLEFDRDG